MPPLALRVVIRTAALVRVFAPPAPVQMQCQSDIVTFLTIESKVLCKIFQYCEKLLIVTLLTFSNSVKISEYHCTVLIYHQLVAKWKTKSAAAATAFC